MCRGRRRLRRGGGGFGGGGYGGGGYGGGYGGGGYGGEDLDEVGRCRKSGGPKTPQNSTTPKVDSFAYDHPSQVENINII